ncbi:hypothetical protein [Pedosphaera parvula]|uniref:Uncharacterized protein n=1 Tax=Pedosphaera parvula (strain Ellin514) TaxID=320771 RepID=B9XCH1_PEDPL|nr:hypothetical protein [Pedosphaera parvula]EEF62639.1 hypothetical protein Cflav_PD5274 [Pedosphaera parvula Ellin514]
MNKKEFISQQQAMIREGKKPVMILLIGSLSVFFGLLFAGTLVDDHKEYAWLGGMVIFGLIIFVIGAGVLTIRFTKAQQKKFGMNCPACNKPVSGVGVQIAIATGSCGHCGESIFEE